MMPRWWPDIANVAAVLTMVGLAVLECWWLAALALLVSGCAVVAMIQRESR